MSAAARLRALADRLRTLFGGRPAALAAADEEIAQHLRMLAQRFEQQGLSPEQAAQAASRQFGNVTLQQEDRRALQTFPSIERGWRNLRHGARQLRRNPLFTATALLSLALGLGVNTAVFTLLDQLVLRPIPVAEPDRLVMIWATGPNLGDTRGARASSFPLCEDYQRHAAGAFDAVFCRYTTDAALTIDTSTENVQAELVSGNYFDGLRVRPALGRLFSSAEDDRVDRGHPVAIISHRFWRDRFAASPHIIGKKVLVNGQPMDIIGVAAEGFAGLDSASAPQIWLSLRMKALLTPGEDGLHDRRYDFVQLFGRLGSAQTAASAQASLQPLFRQRLEEMLKEPAIARVSAFDRDRFLQRTVIVERAATGYSEMRERYGLALAVLMGMAALILLVACANVAALLVARGLARRKEMAVRLSIGAGRGVLIAQLLVESLLLAVTGAALGLWLAFLASRALIATLPVSTGTLLLRPEPDLRVFAFGIVAAVATALIFGLLPALQATRIDLCSSLKASTGAISGASGSTRLRKGLVVGQVALSLLLLVTAGLFVRTLTNLRHSENGLDRLDTLVTFQIDPAKRGYSIPRMRQLYADLQADIQSTPGVRAASYTWVPLLLGWAPTWHMRVEGHTAHDGEDMEIASNLVAPGYWRTMGMTLLEGRDFEPGDAVAPSEQEGTMPSVAIVNRRFAQRFFAGRSALGQRFGIGDRKDALEVRIIGVVDDAMQAGPRNGLQPQVFFSYLQANYPVSTTFYVRAEGDPQALLPALRRLVARRDPTLPVAEMKTLERQLDETLSAERLIASLSSVFALLATVMAALGLYGVLAFGVTRRTRELGLRAALGASPRSTMWLVMGEGLGLLAVGVAIGLPCAWLIGRFVASQLFGVTPGDPVTLVGAGVLLAVVTVVAGALPARRAAAIDPLVALRHE